MKKGWCPSLAAPMAASDGFLLRISPAHGRLDAAGAFVIAAAAERHGNGAIELTNRGNLQLRGFAEGSAAAFASVVRATGLTLDSGRVIASPLLGLDPALHEETGALVARISADLALLAFDGPAEKFLVAIDGGGVLGLGRHPARADILIEADGADWRVLLDGAGAANVVSAKVPAFVSALAEAVAARSANGVYRVRDLVRVLGADRLFNLCGLARAAVPQAIEPRPVGFVGYAATRGAFGLGIAFGALNPHTLRCLADLAVTYGDGTLRLTPWRTVLLPGVDRAGTGALIAAADPFVTDPDDDRLAISACIGKAGCAAASTDTRADAVWLAKRGFGRGLHVSGCAKGCAHPAASAVTLVGVAGRYDIVRNGRAQDTPVAIGLSRDAVGDWLRVTAAA